MYLGKIVEIGTREQVYERSTHPYTQSLLSAVPVPDPLLRGHDRRILLAGDVADPTDPPSGCRFRTRCWKSRAECAEVEPELVMREGSDHPSACLFPETLTVGRPPTSGGSKSARNYATSAWSLGREVGPHGPVEVLEQRLERCDDGEGR